MHLHKAHEFWGSELKSHLEPCLLLGSWESETDYQHNQCYLFNSPSGPVRLSISQGPRWYPYLQPTGLEKPAVISQGLGAWSFLKISRNPPTSTISASSARTVQLSKSFLESVAGGTLRARVYTDTHTRRSHLYWIKYTKWELIKNQGKS